MVWGSNPGRGMRYFSSPKRSDRLWAPLTHQFNGGTGIFLSAVTGVGREIDHSPQSSAEVKNEWSYTILPPICLHGVGRDNFLDFKLSPCFEYCMYSFGYFPGVRLLFADVSEPSINSIFKGWM